MKTHKLICKSSWIDIVWRNIMKSLKIIFALKFSLRRLVEIEKNSLVTWPEVAQAFISKYFPSEKTTDKNQ